MSIADASYYDNEERAGMREEAGEQPADGVLFDTLSDLGNARRFALQHADRVRWVEELGGWHVYDGRRWKRDRSGAVVRLAIETIKAIYQEAALAPDPQDRRKIADHALKSESANRIREMVSLARNLQPLPAEVAEFDVDPFLLNVLNGTLDLRSATLRPHSARDMLTKLAPVNYDADAQCPTFDAFLVRIMDGNADLIRFLQRAVGYSLTGDVGAQVFFLLYGTGANGKSKFLGIIRDVLGEYAKTAEFSSFVSRQRDSGPRNDLARLVGSRFVSSIEAESGQRLAESMIKSVTGNDTITARFLYGEHFEFVPQFKLWLAANHKPVIKGGDNAIWRRPKLIPFSVTIPEAERDEQLGDKLAAEASGVLRWSVEGCLAWQREGLGEPAEVRNATDEYREEMDVLGDFLQQHCRLGEHHEAEAGDLYAAYRRWCEAAGEQAAKQRTFGAWLTERGFVRFKTGTGRKAYRGLALLNHGSDGP